MNRTLPGCLFLLAFAALGCSRDAATAAKPASSGGSGGSAQAKEAHNTVAVPPDAQSLAGIRTATVSLRTVPRTLVVPGQMALDAEHTVQIAPYSDGRVVDVLKQAGDAVVRGTVLAHLHSHAVHETVGALAQDYANLSRAQAALGFAQGKRDRYAHLYAIQAASLEQQQGSQQELVQATTEVANANAAVTMEREHLADLLQIEPSTIRPETLYSYELVPILSPIAGTVVTRSITPGMVLEPGTEAYSVSDLRELWMIASVHEGDLSHLRTGQRVVVRSDAWPEETFAGTVTLIGSMLDPATRTVQVRVSLPNRAGHLKPAMFTTATIDEGATRQALFVPEEALEEMNGVSVAFVTRDGTHFTPAALQTLPPVNGSVEVTQGLRPGDRIAVAGAFMLKSDLLKGTIGDD